MNTTTLDFDPRALVERCIQRGLIKSAAPPTPVQASTFDVQGSKLSQKQQSCAAADAAAQPILRSLLPIVAGEFGFPTSDLTQRNGTWAACDARGVWWTLSHEFSQSTLSAIGRCACATHVTVLHAIKKIKNRVTIDAAFAHKLQSLRARCRGALYAQGLIEKNS